VTASTLCSNGAVCCTNPVGDVRRSACALRRATARRGVHRLDLHALNRAARVVPLPWWPSLAPNPSQLHFMGMFVYFTFPAAVVMLALLLLPLPEGLRRSAQSAVDKVGVPFSSASWSVRSLRVWAHGAIPCPVPRVGLCWRCTTLPCAALWCALLVCVVLRRRCICPFRHAACPCPPSMPSCSWRRLSTCVRGASWGVTPPGSSPAHQSIHSPLARSFLAVSPSPSPSRAHAHIHTHTCMHTGLANPVVAALHLSPPSPANHVNMVRQANLVVSDAANKSDHLMKKVRRTLCVSGTFHDGAVVRCKAHSVGRGEKGRVGLVAARSRGSVHAATHGCSAWRLLSRRKPTRRPPYAPAPLCVCSGKQSGTCGSPRLC
jgi:hypothetical protein